MSGSRELGGMSGRPVATMAFRLHGLWKDALGLSPEEDAKYLLKFLFQHAQDWAAKQPDLDDIDAFVYALEYVNEFGDIWVDQMSAPSHWEAIQVLHPARNLEEDAMFDGDRDHSRSGDAA